MSFDLPPVLVLGEGAARMHAAAAAAAGEPQQVFGPTFLPLLTYLISSVLGAYWLVLTATANMTWYVARYVLELLAPMLLGAAQIAFVLLRGLADLAFALNEIPLPTAPFHHLWRLLEGVAAFAHRHGRALLALLWVVLAVVYAQRAFRALDARVRLQVRVGDGGRLLAVLRFGLVDGAGGPTRCLGLAVYGRGFLPDIPGLEGGGSAGGFVAPETPPERQDKQATMRRLLVRLLRAVYWPASRLEYALCALLALSGAMVPVLLQLGGAAEAGFCVFVLMAVWWPQVRLAVVLWRGRDVARSFAVRNTVLTFFHLTYVPGTEVPGEERRGEEHRQEEDGKSSE